jgi:tetratricopeptide (TPR) repeat protein
MASLSDLAPRWPEINALLDQALALPSDNRAAWLDALQLEPAALKETLRDLLAEQARVETNDFLNTWPRLAGVQDARSGSNEPAAGDAVGPYRLLRELGSGGMGTVWLAERADGQLKREVALKLPRLAWGGALAERLARERDILASLTHPHIARLYDAGVDAIGRPWLAIEYVEGKPIDAHCREMGLDTKARVRLLLDVAGAVSYAHGKQVLHRDLKPSNILVTRDGQVRLLDFGIAKLMHDNRAGETALTQALGRALTPEYASPEQVRGEALSAASDVYSLGVVAYELLTGAKPYRLKRGSAAEIEEAIVSADAPAASASAGDAASARALRGDLDAILNHALRKEPGQRYATVEALADDLRRHLDGGRVQARPDSLLYRATRLWRAHAVLISLGAAALAAFAAAVGLGATALLIVVLSAGLLGAAWQTRRAMVQARATAQQAARADAVQQFLVDLLGSAGFGVISAEQRRAITVDQLLERAAQRLHERPATDPQVQEALLAVVAQLFQGLGLHAQAIALQRELAHRLAARGAPPLERARVHAAIGKALLECDDVAGGIEAYAAAITALDGLDGADAALARAHVQALLAVAHHHLGDNDEGSRWIQAATASPLWRRGDAAIRADILGALSSESSRHGRMDEAEAFLREAILCDAQCRDAMDPEAIERRVNLARHVSAGQRFAEAEAELRATLAIFDSAGEPHHPTAVRIVLEFVKPLLLMGRVPEALTLIAPVAAAVRRQPQRYPPLTLQRLAQSQADLLLEDGRIEEAAALVIEGVDPMCESVEPYEATIAMGVKGRFLTDTGRFDEARQWLERSLALRSSLFGQWHRLSLVGRNRIAMVAIAQRRFAEALAALDELLSHAPPHTPQQPYGLPRDVGERLRAQCLLELQRPDEALATLGEHLRRHLALPDLERPASGEIALRLLAARALIALQRIGDAWPHLQALDALAQPLFEHAPQRIDIDAAWAHALALGGRHDDAQARLRRADAVLAAQPSLGPQFRRSVDHVRALLARPATAGTPLA